MIYHRLSQVFTRSTRRFVSIFALGTIVLVSACDEDDPRAAELRSDMGKLANAEASGIVDVSQYIRECLGTGEIIQPDNSIKQLGAVNVFSRANGSKLLLLVEYPDVKEITEDTQPVLFAWLEGCATEVGAEGYDFYMAWTTGIITSFVQTPEVSSAEIVKDETALYAFYDGLSVD